MAAPKKEMSDQLAKNVRFYNRVMEVPEEAQKEFNNGRFSGTDINPMWRIKMLTELFGPAGFGWWTQNVRYDFVDCPETKEIHVFCELELIVKDPETGEASQPIYGVGGNTYLTQGKYGARASDEAKKMAYTDAVSIACKSLGFGHNVWFSKDQTKYTINDVNSSAPAPKSAPKAAAKVETQPKVPASSEPENHKEEPEAKHTPDTATVISEIDARLKVLGSDMSREEKKEFAQKVIYPTLGTMNYKSCTDITKLIELRDKLPA